MRGCCKGGGNDVEEEDDRAETGRWDGVGDKSSDLIGEPPPFRRLFLLLLLLLLVLRLPVLLWLLLLRPRFMVSVSVLPDVIR